MTGRWMVPGIACTVPMAPLQVCRLLKRLALNQDSCYAIRLGLEATEPEVHTKPITWDQPLVVKYAYKQDEVQCSPSRLYMATYFDWIVVR